MSMPPHLSVQKAIAQVLDYIGEDVHREGLLKTPERVMRSYATLFSGYSYKDVDIKQLLNTVFVDGSCDEMVVLKQVEFVSHCEHHMIPFFGHVSIGYIPDGRIVGVSKLARLLEVYTRRLQVQERLCQQITDALMEHLKPKGAACVIEATHLCMVARGVHKQNSKMITSSLKGAFLEVPAARQEFFNIIK